MNKMKKLLSVILAVVLALSCMSVMASAAKTNYKSVANLEALGAYSDYGQVTRLSTEERTSIILDALDNLLPSLNINMGEVFNVLGLSVTIDLTSVDRLCYSFDTIKDTFNNTLASIAMAIVDLGILESLSVDKWTTGMTRDGTDQYTILSTILAFLSDNTTLVGKVFTDGLDLGLVSLGDMSAIEDIIFDLPSLVKGLIFGLFERWDDTLAEIQTLDNNSAGNGKVEATLNTYVKSLLSNDMSITTIKYDANGVMTSEHTTWAKNTGSAAPGTPTAASPRYYYQINDKTMTVYHIVDAKEAKDLAKDADTENDVAAYNYVKEEQQYTLTEEVAGNGVYVWKAIDKNGNVLSTLKWYNDNSQFLDGALKDKIDLTEGMSAGDILYKFLPVLFEDMAVVVLNGSVKWALSKFVGVQWTYVGEGGPEADDKVMALADSSDSFFTAEQGEYMFEWSDYKVINGNHYYRFEDQIWSSSLDNVNNYFDIINWDFEVTADLFSQFVPTSDNDASVRLLVNLNDFLVKVAELVLLPSAATDDTRTEYTATWTLPTLAAGNANLVSNIKALAQAVIKLAPQHIFGDDYAENERCYYELMISNDNDTVLTGLAAQLVDIIMPSMTLPGKTEIASSGAKVGAILAAVIREFAISLAPEYNYDALIYKTYENGTKTFVTPSADGLVTSGDTEADYWLDVILTMGLNVGFEYIRAFADLGEGTDQWKAFVSYSGYGETGKTYAAGTTQAQLNAEWEGMLDYIIDWALEKDYEWTWKMENLVDVSPFTVDLATAQDPWVKLDTILGSLLPVTEILTVAPDADQTNMEHWLRDDLILGIVNLKWDHLIDTLQFNGSKQYFRTDNVIDQLATLLKNVVNGIFKKVGGGSFALIPSDIIDFDSLANQNNLVAMIKSLVGVLHTAGVTNGGCDTLLPFLNFLLGWKTDPQKIADPQIWTSFRDGNDYAFQNNVAVNGAIDSENTKLVILNNSSGMLEKHRESTVTDHAYDINIKSVKSDASNLTFTYPDTIAPYEQAEIKIGGTYTGEQAVTITIEYDYVGKDGKAVGGTQYTSRTYLFSNQSEDANIDGRKDGDNDKDYTGIDQYKRYQFTEDIYTTITQTEASIFWVEPTVNLGTSSKDFMYYSPYGGAKEGDCDTWTVDWSAGTQITGQAANYFQYDQTADWPSKISKNESIKNNLYAAKAGVTAETVFPYGHYDMGHVSVKYGSDEKEYEIDFIYYNDYNVYDIYTENAENGYNANQGVDEATYNEYNAAWKDIVKYATYPMMTSANGNSATDYVATIQPYIPDAITRYEAAKEAYETALADAQASASASADAKLPSAVQKLADALAADDNIGEKEINFRDYDFYEYFNYADLRTAHRNYVKTYYAPEVMDTYYILNSGISEEELDKVIAAEDNEFIAAGITASRLQNDQAAIDASQAAHDEWTMPVDSTLLIEDMTSRLLYYKQFVNDNVKEPVSTMNVYLEKEIKFVEAQNLVEADYTADSWAAYADALEKAKAVLDGTAEYATFVSSSFDAKYNLMVAYKNLLAKDDSLIEAGGTAALNANIATANEIFASLAAADGTWALKEGVDANEAYAALISALGYNYVGEDGNTWNLYADSALEYSENDRPDRQGNQAKVDTANENLVAAIANFEMAATAPELGAVDGTTGVIGETTTDETTGLVTGYIYGVTAGDTAENYFELVDEKSGTVEWTASAGGSVNGTGAVATVKDTKGNVVAEYTLVIFGDVTGDGDVKANDYALVLNAVGGADIGEEPYQMAADVTGDGETKANDYALVLNAVGGANITVNPYNG